jgi:hypothetical protein
MRKNFNLTIWIVGADFSKDYVAEQIKSRLEAAPTTGSRLGCCHHGAFSVAEDVSSLIRMAPQRRAAMLSPER